MYTTIAHSFKVAPPRALLGKPRRIANNTFDYRTTSDSYVVRLHLTDIFELQADGRIRITSGGYKTTTTKDRLNAVLRTHGYGVVSGDGSWVVIDGTGRQAPFYDGMLLPDAFSGKELAKAQKIGEGEAKLKAQIKAFVLKTLPTGKPMPLPDEGDCWYCLMFDKEEPNESEIKYLGGDSEKPVRQRDSSHLLAHVQEGYMHGSLIVNAMRDAGFKDQGISMICFGSRPDYNRVRRTVRRYLQKRLGLTY